MRNVSYQLVFVFFTSSLLFFSCYRAQSERSGYAGSRDQMPTAPGKCFARCLIPDQTSIDTLGVFPIYNGANPGDVRMNEFVIHEGRSYTKWIKKKADRNCLAPDPDDCLVWCLVEMKEEKETINYMVDTTENKEFEMKLITRTNVEMEGGYTEWREVLCEKDIDRDLIKNLSLSLMARDYISAETQLKMDMSSFSPELKAALIKFQTDQGLPIGQLDMETLEVLNVQ